MNFAMRLRGTLLGENILKPRAKWQMRKGLANYCPHRCGREAPRTVLPRNCQAYAHKKTTNTQWQTWKVGTQEMYDKANCGVHATKGYFYSAARSLLLALAGTN